MSHRAVAQRLVLALAALTGLAAAGCAKPRPNLLLITLDTTRADHLGAYGYPGAKTPAIDALARRGFLFRRHLTPVPLTLPAHTTIMTGRYPPTHTVHDNGTFFVPAAEVTIAEVLAGAGYQTSAFVGSFPLEHRFGLDQGFARYNDDFYRDARDREQRPRIEGVFFEERPAGHVVDAWLSSDREQLKRPFFTWLHFFDPHQPQLPPPPFDVEFRDRPYDGEIAYVDSQLARVFAALDERGELDSTVIVVTADHGEGLGEHGELTHAMLLHQATLHVPLIIAGPGVPHGETDAWTIAPQLFRTLLDLTGVSTPAAEIATEPSLSPLLTGQAPAAQAPAEFSAYFETIAPRTTQGWSQLTGFMRGDRRYIHGPKPELYDLARDPGELANLFAEDPKTAGRLRLDLERFLKERETAPVSAALDHIDRGTLEKLAALGYLQASSEDLRTIGDLMDVRGLTDPKDRIIDINVFSEAKSAMAQERWALAESLWRELVRRNPRNTSGYRGLAYIHGLAGHAEEALAMLDRGLAAAPEATDLARLKGELLVEWGRFSAAIPVLEALPKNSVEAATWLGQAYAGAGDPASAERTYRAGLELDPKAHWLRLYLANLLASEGRFAEAEGHFQQLVRDQPYFVLGFYNYGKLMIDQRRLREARKLLGRAAELWPQYERTAAALRYLDAVEAGGKP